MKLESFNLACFKLPRFNRIPAPTGPLPEEGWCRPASKSAVHAGLWTYYAVMVVLASAIITHGSVQVSETMPGTGIDNATGPTLLTSSSFSMNGGNAVALLFTAERSGTGDAITAAFAGQPMTLGASTSQGVQWAGIFYLLNPSTTSGQFVVSTTGTGADCAYSAIALTNAGSVADWDAVANTATGGTIALSYTTATNGGFVLGAAANNGWDSGNPAPSFVSGNADQTLFRSLIDSSGHLHTHGDVAISANHTDTYGNLIQRNAYATLAFETANYSTNNPPPPSGSFGVADNGTEYVVNTGAGLVFEVNKANGSVVSWLFNGTEYTQSANSSHIASGLGSMGTSVTATNLGSVVKITIQTDASNGVAADLTHYLIVTNGVNNLYMATYPVNEPGVGELRWITRLNSSLLPNRPVPSNASGNTGAIESSDVFGMPDGTTRSKYYGDGTTHSKDRALELTYCGMSGSNVGVWMVYGNRESSSGGPFFRDIQVDGAVYNYMNSGHCQTEANRLSVLHGPYVLVWNNGSAPTLPIDTSWLGSLGLTGWVGASGRGTVSGTASGVRSGIEGVVGLANASAQYWSKVNPNGTYTISGVKPGSYTATLYQGELAVATTPVSVSAGATSTLNLASTWPNPSLIFKIGEWDGTPQGFLNATNILGYDSPNFITMHPSDIRMNTWGTVTFLTASDPVSKFNSIMMRGVPNSPMIKFNLTAGQITNLTLRIGGTVAYNGGRPRPNINGTDLSFPGASSQPNSRSWTIGTYRGNNVLWTWTISSNNLVVGENTLSIGPVSGSSDLSTWLSAGWVWDCVQLEGPAGGSPPSPPSAPTGLDVTTVSDTQIELSWTASSGATSYNVKRASVSGGPYTTIATDVTGTTHSDTGLAASTTYYYVVSAVNSGGESPDSTEAIATTQPPPATPPTFVAAGSIASGTGTVMPSLPSGLAAGDVLLLFVETANQAVSISNPNGGTWTEVVGSPQGTGSAGGSSATCLTAFWSRYNGTQGNPTVSDSGNHQVACMIAIRGAASSGNPWEVTAGGVESTSDTSASIPGATTTVANTLVVVAVAGSLPDANGTSNFSGWSNASLANLTERTDNTRSSGNGGALGIATGEKVAAGAYGNTAVTHASAAVKGMLSIAIKK
jgi:rhamnogalacturonan endolyase